MKEKQTTPLMKQYTQIKNKYPETILLFRLGDFFETFEDDAVITAKVCGITLTKRNNGGAGDMPLAGFPHHQLDVYLPKLVKAGYRVAVCEQLEDPKSAKGIVKRGVVEVVTPGVALYDKLLDIKVNNYLVTINVKRHVSGFHDAGAAVLDVSTGEFFAFETTLKQLNEVLEGFAPAEIVINKEHKYEIENVVKKLSFNPSVTKLEDWIFEEDFGRDLLLRHFNTKNLKGFGIEEMTLGLGAAGAALHYVSETQKGSLPHIKKISRYNALDYMTLDAATRRNLEITFSFAGDGKEGTLISILDKTVTAMGGRLFKKWITRPLKKLDSIKARLEAVRALIDHHQDRLYLIQRLKEMNDLERLISKVCIGRANPREIVSLRESLKLLPDIKEIIKSFNTGSLNILADKIDTLSELVDMLEKALVDDPAIQAGSGNIFRQGYNQQLDEYVDAKYSAHNWLTKYQEKLRSETGISTLKTGFNSVFGYYIEVTKVHSKKVPESFQRKQTLTNAERYITPELKEFENKILTAEEKLSILETELLTELKNKIAAYTEKIQENARLVAMADCLQSYATASKEFNYVEPEIDDSEVLEIDEGRHPVVEQLLPPGESFNPNSTMLNIDEKQIHIITGPNMAGKSCYLRQVGLIVLLAQIGCFVPAKKARVGIVDRIFTRVGAHDNIVAGESTFLVEMQESANILNNATEKSLILLDEVGRGTATFDGISIAWSIAEFIHNKIGAKTLFATHYHELNDLSERYKRIKNYKVEVIETGQQVIFSHNVKEGASDHSFGIHVAKMAGLPYDVINRADEIMALLEESSSNDSNGTTAKPNIASIDTKKNKDETDQLAIFEVRDDNLRERLLEININNLTPVQALQILAEMHQDAKKERKKK